MGLSDCLLPQLSRPAGLPKAGAIKIQSLRDWPGSRVLARAKMPELWSAPHGILDTIAAPALPGN